MIELSEDEMQVLFHIDLTSEDNQYFLGTDDSIRFSEIKDALNIHPQILTRILKKLIDKGLIANSTLRQFFAKMTKEQLENYYRSHFVIKRPSLKKPSFYWITPLGEKLIKEIEDDMLKLTRKMNYHNGFKEIDIDTYCKIRNSSKS